MTRSILQHRLTGLMKAAACGLLSLSATMTYGQCTTNPLEAPASYFNSGYDGSGNFNAIIFGDYDVSSNGGKTTGRLMVGGDFTNLSTGYMVGVGDLSDASKDNLVVGGELENNGTMQVRGDARYATAQGTLPGHATGGTNAVGTGLVNYAGLRTYYQGLSTSLAATAQTSGVTVTHTGGILTLTGTGTVQDYVFNASSIFGDITDIVYVNIPAGSGILVNFTDNDALISFNPGSGSSAMESTHRAKTVFNFPNATTLSLNEFIIEGSILAPNADLNSVGFATIRGASVIGGDVIFPGEVVFETACTPSVLPVKLTAFSARREGTGANLSWETTFETVADKFVIERRSTGKAWSVLGEVAAKGESRDKSNYAFFDATPQPGSNLYRLKMMDLDGTFAYSRIVNLNTDFAAAVETYPNPVSEMLTIRPDASFNVENVTILDNSGKPVFSKKFDGRDINVRHLPVGLYVVKLTADNGVLSSHKIVKK